MTMDDNPQPVAISDSVEGCPECGASMTIRQYDDPPAGYEDVIPGYVFKCLSCGLWHHAWSYTRPFSLSKAVRNWNHHSRIWPGEKACAYRKRIAAGRNNPSEALCAKPTSRPSPHSPSILRERRRPRSRPSSTPPSFDSQIRSTSVDSPQTKQGAPSERQALRADVLKNTLIAFAVFLFVCGIGSYLYDTLSA